MLGRGSTLAPTSHRVSGPAVVGNTVTRAGRSTPGLRPRTNRAWARTAPLGPADTSAAAPPACTRSIARRSELARLLRKAAPGWSSAPTTSAAWTTRTARSWAAPSRASSLRLAIDRVQAGGAAALVSAGPSGAVLAHALFVLGRSPGVERPALVTVFPTTAGPLTLCDVGANVEPRPSMLAQFGVLGAAYDRVVHGRARPRVGLLANGTEPGKGTELTRAAAPLLAAAAARGDFHFVGYVEGSGIWDGAVDVVATDGFTGNVVLKACEGVATALFGLVRQRLTATPVAKLGGALVAPALRDLGRRIDFAETGGALLAGVDGVVVIAHGRSDTTAMKNAVLMAARFARAELSTKIAAVIGHTVAG